MARLATGRRTAARKVAWLACDEPRHRLDLLGDRAERR
jgi:hypothetical protein